MVTYAEYFAKRDADKPKPKYHSGDRVFGHWNKIPFVASVIREENNQVLVHADLPLKFNDVYQTILTVTVKDVKLMKVEE